EEQVAGREARERDPLRLRHFPAHLVGRPAVERGRERATAGVGLEPVDAPGEAGAVEATARGDAEERLGELARPAPDIRVADEAHRRREHAPLPDVERRDVEGIRVRLDAGRFTTRESEDARGGASTHQPSRGHGSDVRVRPRSRRRRRAGRARRDARGGRYEERDGKEAAGHWFASVRGATPDPSGRGGGKTHPNGWFVPAPA